ncbi:MAG: mechanosensitive ion channel family protein [Myxococcales bacterium]|nr:mechanosensitive ion channel family protein [Myxococcales bacterium]
MNLDQIFDLINVHVVPIGIKLLGGLLFWIIGGWCIGLAIKLVKRSLERSGRVDDTVRSYIYSSLSVVLKIALVVGILGWFGVETTTFAALIAAAGVAIGMAWSGLLSNFAAGVFLVVLRPFRVGDFVTVGGVTGTIREIGLFVTTLDSLDNVLHIVGNNKVFSETIQNFTSNPYRRVDLVAQLDHSVDYNDAIERLRARLRAIPNVVAEPAPDVHILEFTPMGPVLCVRPYTHNDHYWDVFFATNAAIREEFGEAGYPAPEQHFHIRSKAA